MSEARCGFCDGVVSSTEIEHRTRVAGHIIESLVMGTTCDDCGDIVDPLVYVAVDILVARELRARGVHSSWVTRTLTDTWAREAPEPDDYHDDDLWSDVGAEILGPDDVLDSYADSVEIISITRDSA